MAENHEHSRFIYNSYYYDGHRLDPSDLDLKAYIDERIAANPSPGGSSYLSYTALLTQSGSDAPVAIVPTGGNTLGFIPTFTREASGEYTIVKDGGWDPAKTWFFFQPCDSYNDNSCRSVQAEIISDGPIVNQIYFTTRSADGSPNDWGGAQGTIRLPVKIEVYP